MIVGNGLIARSLKKFEDNDNVLVFASGVSNSNEQDLHQFNRERDLLKKYLNCRKRIIYFSTIGVNDDSVNQKDYFKFKIEQENTIMENYDQNVIIRLPNVIGGTNNNHTFFNAITKQLLEGNLVRVQHDAYRYFVHASDLELILTYLMQQGVYGIVNCVYDNKIKVADAVKIMAEHLNVKSEIQYQEGGINYAVPTPQVMTDFISCYKDAIKLSFSEMASFEYQIQGLCKNGAF